MKIEHINIGDLEIKFTIGKSAKENFEIIDSAKSQDLWFHIEGYPSGHVIASIPNGLEKDILKYIAKQGAVVCKKHSKYASYTNIPIVYTKIQNVKKTKILGSVITKDTKIIKI